MQDTLSQVHRFNHHSSIGKRPYHPPDCSYLAVVRDRSCFWSFWLQVRLASFQPSLSLRARETWSATPIWIAGRACISRVPVTRVKIPIGNKLKFERNEATDEMHFAAARSISLRGGPVWIARNPLNA